MLKRFILIICFTACCVILFSSCSATRFVGNGEYLLDRTNIKTDNRSITNSSLKPYLQQHSNYRIFGLLKIPLYVYNLSGRNEKRWINRQLRKMGEPPVIFNPELAEQSKNQIEQYLANSGYINARVNFSTDTARRKKAILNYNVETGIPYRIYNYNVHISDHKIDSILKLKPPRKTFFQSLFGIDAGDNTVHVRQGMLFDRVVLNRERQRISTLLRRNGYYAFNRDNIEYTADSSFNEHRVDLDMYIRPLETEISNGASGGNAYNRQYYINSVKILTDYDPFNPEETGEDYHITDSTSWRGINIYYGKNGRSIRPQIFQQSCYIVQGRLFNEQNVEQTYESFSALNALRYVTLKFTEFEKSDTMKLDCTILTAPAKKQGVYFDVEGTNSAGDFGFASSLTYQHRNLFKGSELFSAKIRGGYEYLSAKLAGNYWEYAGEASIHFPHFVFPFVNYDFKRRIRATTEFKMSYDQQQRPEYHRSILSGGWIYHWQNRNNTMGRHTFKLLDVNYVFLPYIEGAFKEKLPETTALYNYSNQFVVSTGYVYSFNNYDPMERGKNTYSYRVAIESAGNLMYTLSNILGAKKDASGRYNLFGVNYSEFLKGDLDFARSFTIDMRNNVAFHIGAGLAYPFGNTKEIPFDRRYYAGGANSNRGWNVRSLGPGSMPLTDSTSFINQAGDIRLDINLEYRTKLFWKFELAAYVDAGNIWTIRKYDYQPKGDFDFRRFYKEIALSYGLGLRLDFNYFLVRFDTGMKARNPQENSKWVILNPNFRKDFAWHFAVGYPF
ncbi:MAG: sorting and assembly machinery component 50 [Tannerella sp.]|nr:sorting and assembly machinery component 50 [Tannerella sp.]